MTRTNLALKVLALFLTIAFVFVDGAQAQDATAPNADEPGAMISQALRLYSAGDCAAALPLGEKAAEQLRTQNKATADLGMALVVEALCLKKLARVTEAERVYREAIAIYESVQGPNGVDLAVAIDNLASLYMENGRLDEAEQLRASCAADFQEHA